MTAALKIRAAVRAEINAYPAAARRFGDGYNPSFVALVVPFVSNVKVACESLLLKSFATCDEADWHLLRALFTFSTICVYGHLKLRCESLLDFPGYGQGLKNGQPVTK